MNSMYGNLLKISLFGESHGECVGATIDGLPSGIKLDFDFINKEMQKRKAKGNISTQRHEEDDVEFVSGLFNGVTTGCPLTIIIKNRNVISSDYEKNVARPSHGDYAYYVKTNGNNDYRGGGHSSGRLTAPLVAIGAICKQVLNQKDVKIASHISSIHGVCDASFDMDKIDEQIQLLNGKYFAVIDEEKEVLMKREIENAQLKQDSVGGTIQTVVRGVECGVGEPFFNSVESEIASLLFSIGGVKGVTFGDGVDFANKFGSEVSDGIRYDGEIKFEHNHNGGINSGITNGNNIIINTYVKPTPSISLTQHSVDLATNENVDLNIKGRHDPCIVHRVRAVVEALVAFAILDLMMINNSKKGF